MDDIKLLKLSLLFGIPFLLFLVFLIVLMSNQSASGDASVVVVARDGFAIPFEKTSYFMVTSEFGSRLDPFGSGDTKFHSGMDLGASCGTNILATADGIVYEVGFSPTGLGNYVYIKHETEDGTLYSAYGHMLDNSIIVEKNQPIVQGQPLGQVGSTGASTGCHLHFMLMNKKISFKKEDLINPNFIINGLN